MKEGNDKIGVFQFGILVFFLVNSLFFGLGIPIMFVLAKQDAWIVASVSSIAVLISLLAIIYTFSYKPDKNILEKNKIMFGKIIGSIINFILFCYFFFLMVLILKSSIAFAITMYLTETPSIVIGGVLILVCVYAVIKGIETILRTSEVLFFISLIIFAVSNSSLLSHFNLDYIKPIMPNGFMPLIKVCILYFSYSFAPLILLGIIPKDKIQNNKKLCKYVIIGFALATFLLLIQIFITPGVISETLASLYRFPGYYMQRKVSIGPAFNNVENFTSVYWFFNTTLLIIMCIYFISTYMNSMFKIIKKNKQNIVIIVIGVISVIAVNYIFKNPASITNFMIKNFPYCVSLVLLGILLFTCITIFIRNRLEKKLHRA